MEYALRLNSLENASKGPREFCDPTLWELCPEGPLTALYFGSEFCQELIPCADDAEAFCAHCAEHKLQAVLLTPLATNRGLTGLTHLLDALEQRGCSPAVVFNDWGVFDLLSKHYPALSLRMGRLINRGLRDPRLEMQTPVSAGENTNRGKGIRKLAISLGVTAVESDADLEPGYLGGYANGLQRTLHIPFTFVASGRNCLEKAASKPAGQGVFTQGLRSGCNAPCRGVSRRELRQDTQKELWRAGNTVFFKAPPKWIARHLELADRVVLHERPAA